MDDLKDTIIDGHNDDETEEEVENPDPKDTIVDEGNEEAASQEATLADNRRRALEAMEAAAKLIPTDKPGEDDPEEGDPKQTMMPTSQDHLDAMQGALGHNTEKDSEDGDK